MRPGFGRLAFGVLAGSSASVLLSLPAHADERDISSGTVTVAVQIDPLECAAGCGGTPPATALPATGLASVESLLWIALAFVMAGAVLALRARTARHMQRLAPSASATAYAVVSGERAPVGDHPTAEEHSACRTTERGDRA